MRRLYPENQKKGPVVELDRTLPKPHKRVGETRICLICKVRAELMIENNFSSRIAPRLREED